MNVLQEPTTVIQMPHVATHRFPTAVLAMLVILGMDFPVQVIQLPSILNYSSGLTSFIEKAIDL